ncbi:MAG: acyltransferase [Patescibacteria group bacterium]|nr:acyltransferase [Patescibacteria group bacterium]
MAKVSGVLGGIFTRIPIGLFSYRVSKQFERSPEVRIGRFVRIVSNHVTLGKGSSIGQHSKIQSNILIMEQNSKLQHHVTVSVEHLDVNSNLRIGENAVVFTDSVLDCTAGITIGKNVGIGGRSLLFTHGGWEIAGHKTKYGPIEIKDNAWLAWDVKVCPNVTIGEGAVVGLSAVVTRNVPDRAVVAGNPARIIKFR